MLNQGKKGTQKPVIQHIENVQSGLVRWGFIVIYSVMDYLSQVIGLPHSITELLDTSKMKPLELLKDLLKNAMKLQIWLVAILGILIFSLLLLMPVAALYAVEQALLLSRSELMFSLIKRLQGLTKLKTNISNAFSKRKE